MPALTPLQLEQMRNTALTAANYLAAEDRKNAWKNLAEEVRLSPLTSSVARLADMLEALRAEAEESIPVEAETPAAG